MELRRQIVSRNCPVRLDDRDQIGMCWLLKLTVRDAGRLDNHMRGTAALLADDGIDLRGAFAQVSAFLENLGFTITLAPVVNGFLEGVQIVDGALHVERFDDDLAGELLHEAGHLAVLPSAFRPMANGDLQGVSEQMGLWIDQHAALLDPDDFRIRAILQCGECEAVAWSYAAAVDLGIDTRIPFYRGFDNEGLDLHDQVASGYYFGVHGLVAGGMTDLPRPRSSSPFPRMKRWLQL